MYQWAQRTWKARTGVYEGRPIPYSASDQFSASGIRTGDRLYVVGFTDDRQLLLIGRFEPAGRGEFLATGPVDDPCFLRDEAEAVLGPNVYGVPLYEGERYLIPRPDTASSMSFDREIPPDLRIRFRTPQGDARYLYRDPDGKVNRQAVRSMSRLHNSSAQTLEALLDAPVP